MGLDVTSLNHRRAVNRWERVSVGGVLERLTWSFPDKEAIIGWPGAYAHSEYGRLTYRQAAALAARVASGLLAQEVEIHGDDIWQILFTSGTTALPKGATISHHCSHFAAYSFALTLTRGVHPECDLKLAAFLPVIYHVADQVFTFPAFLSGGTLRPGTPFGDLPVMTAKEALRTIAAFRLALPRTILRYAGGRELTLGDLGTRDGLLGGINAVFVGNYLTTLGRDPEEDLALLADLQMPIKALNATV